MSKYIGNFCVKTFQGFLLRVIVLSLLLTFSEMVRCQVNVNVDSLRKDLNLTRHDTSKVQTLYRLCIVLKTDSPLAALKYGKQALNLADAINYEKGRASSLNNLGAVYDFLGEKEKAIDYFIKAFHIKRKLNDVRTLANTLNNIGVIYKRDGDYKNALHYFKLAEQYLTLNPNKVLNYNLMYNIANTYKKLNKNDSAIQIYSKVLAMVREKRDTNLLIDVVINRSEALLKLNFKEEAILDLIKLEEHYKNYILKYEKHGLYTQLTECYLSLNKIDSAFIVLSKLHLSSKDSLDTDLMLTVFKIKTELFYQKYLRTSKVDFLKEAYYYSNLIPKLMIEIEGNQNSKVLSNMIMKSEIDKMEDDISNFKHLNEIASIKSKQKNIVLFVSFAAILIISVLLILNYKKYRIQTVLSEELIKKNEIIELKNSDILSSIQYAKRIQYTLLAHDEFLRNNLSDYFTFFQPKDIVSGDFYWATKYSDRFYLAVCDSTGHGVPGAFMSLLNIGFLSEAINEKGIEKPNEVFDYVRLKLINSISKEGQKDGFDGILICFDAVSKSITYAAANNAPVLVKRGEVAELAEAPADRMPVGVGERKENFTLHTIEARAGDMLYLYTDGYADQFGGPRGKKFKYKQLNELLLSLHTKPLNDQHLGLKQAFEKWRGDLEQLDDVCIIGIRL